MTVIKPDEKTTIDPNGGTKKVTPKTTIIDPPELKPKNNTRFKISHTTAARIEAIARGRTNISRYIDENEAENVWESADHLMALAMSVNASSQIEGEEINANLVPLMLNDDDIVAENTPLSEEATHRLEVNRSILGAYLWAFKCDNKKYVSTDFITKIHFKMFSQSNHYKNVAGKLKTKEVVVTGSLYHVKTLPCARAKEALDELCSRTNEAFKLNKSDKEKPLLTIIAEFLVDFLAIHPFEDGNGRTARLLSTYLLERIGYHFAPLYPIDSIINERRAEYFENLFSAQRNWYTEQEDLTGWVDFYIDCITEQWERAYRKIKRSKSIGTP